MTAAVQAERAGVGPMDEVMTFALQGQVPTKDVISSTLDQDGAAVWAYPIHLEPEQTVTLSFAFPARPGGRFPTVDSDANTQLAETIADWEKAIERTTLDLPDDRIENGFSASLGYLLLALDPDGPHPGPLVHDALWVRDTAYIGLALLQFGHGETVKTFIPTVLEAQETDGRVPPILGNEILWDEDEWDAQGEAIFLVTSTYRHTGDRDTLTRWYPALRAAAQFIAELRATQANSAGPTAGLLPPARARKTSVRPTGTTTGMTFGR